MIFIASLLALALPACQTLTIADVQRAVGAAVTVDPSQSGPGDDGNDFCAWKTPDGRFVILGVGSKVPYAAQLVGAFGGGPPSQAIAGLGDEARYRDYAGDLKGGVVVVRRGSVVLTLEGPMAKDKVLALARVALARVGSQ